MRGEFGGGGEAFFFSSLFISTGGEFCICKI